MGYTVGWLIKNEIVYAKFWGTGDADELRSALIEITHMREQSPRSIVHTITHTQDVTIPVRLQDSMKIIQEFKRNNDDGWEIVIGKLDKIMKLSLSISRSILRNKSINCKTMDEALNHLKKEDTTLSWDKLNQSLIENVTEM